MAAGTWPVTYEREWLQFALRETRGSWWRQVSPQEQQPLTVEPQRGQDSLAGLKTWFNLMNLTERAREEKPARVQISHSKAGPVLLFGTHSSIWIEICRLSGPRAIPANGITCGVFTRLKDVKQTLPQLIWCTESKLTSVMQRSDAPTRKHSCTSQHFSMQSKPGAQRKIWYVIHSSFLQGHRKNVFIPVLERSESTTEKSS